MLIAEIHGLYVPEARNSEDYLTSTVFGHLRYIAPGPFWDAVFGRAVSLPIGSRVLTASQHIRQETGKPLGSFVEVQAIFWPEHKEGIPDLVLHFYGGQARSVVVLVEAKLNATKSGTGDNDQLARYLRLLDSLDVLKPALPLDAITAAVYLTATDSQSEVIESLKQYGDSDHSRRRLYRLQWQDLIGAIDQAQPRSSLERLVLSDVRAFLRARDLEYFSGMDTSAIPVVHEADGEFLQEEPLFDSDSIPSMTDTVYERWMYAD